MKPSLAGGALAVVLAPVIACTAPFFTVYHSAVDAHTRVVAERDNNTELGP